jgi:phosphatidylserine decarboxylase
MSLKLWAHYVLPKKIITILAGILADVTWAPIKNTLIDWFIQSYRVDMTVAREPNYQKYASFNDFFIRLLKPESRLLSSDPIVSPVDGCISQLGDIHKSELLQAKGKYYTVEKLLGSDELADAPRLDYSLFSHFMTIYLSPKDYHRVHAPQDITLTSVTYIPGRLFSVQPLTTFAVPELFARNERFIMHFESDMGAYVIGYGGCNCGRQNWHKFHG